MAHKESLHEFQYIAILKSRTPQIEKRLLLQIKLFGGMMNLRTLSNFLALHRQ